MSSQNAILNSSNLTNTDKDLFVGILYGRDFANQAEADAFFSTIQAIDDEKIDGALNFIDDTNKHELVKSVIGKLFGEEDKQPEAPPAQKGPSVPASQGIPITRGLTKGLQRSVLAFANLWRTKASEPDPDTDPEPDNEPGPASATIPQEVKVEEPVVKAKVEERDAIPATSNLDILLTQVTDSFPKGYKNVLMTDSTTIFTAKTPYGVRTFIRMNAWGNVDKMIKTTQIDFFTRVARNLTENIPEFLINADPSVVNGLGKRMSEVKSLADKAQEGRFMTIYDGLFRDTNIIFIPAKYTEKVVKSITEPQVGEGFIGGRSSRVRKASNKQTHSKQQSFEHVKKLMGSAFYNENADLLDYLYN